MMSIPKFDISALVLLIPGYEDIVGSYRKRYTTDGAIGMPCHITIVYPFMNNTDWNDYISNQLKEISSLIKPISFHFNGLNCFEDKNVLFMEPYPQESIIQAIQQVSRAFPMFPPYKGEIPISDLRAHMTVATAQSIDKLNLIKKDLQKDIRHIQSNPIIVENLTMMIRTENRWEPFLEYKLGTKAGRTN